MKVIHVIAHRVDGSSKPRNMDVIDRKEATYWSGYWDIPLEEAQSAIGGMIFLHERKREPSYFGGEILDARYYHHTKSPRPHRVVFTIRSLKSCRGQKWRGASYSRAWTGRVTEVPDTNH
jgi:hypothetical protein